eukprot:TRINITY_DN11908_c0_g1_i1.p1 TRINITY_DN11908_c0_g1~~TRINITY_DN11908_c0_g1_i1.p1  ORF type:complete len:852 (-),score=189.62 TRINITY_DN11908_c0_g1_i1:362-2917(-)
MGSTNSKSAIEEDDVILRCRERKNFIKQAIENRETLAASHVAYIHCLRNLGRALRQFGQETETILDSSALTSPSTPELVGLQMKSASLLSSSRSSHNNSEHLNMGESSPARSSLSFHGSNSPFCDKRSPVTRMKFMRAEGTRSMTFEQRPPVSPATGTVESYSATPQHSSYYETVSPNTSQKFTNTAPSPPSPQISSWDFFNVFITADSAFGYSDQRGLSQRSEGYFTDSSHMREEEGIPDLEDDQEEYRDGNAESFNAETHTADMSTANGITSSSKVSSKKEDELFSRTDAFTSTQSEMCVEEVPSHQSQKVHEDKTYSASVKTHEEVKEVTDTARSSSKDNSVIDKEAIVESTQCSVFPVNRDRSFFGCTRTIEELFTRAWEAGKEVSRLLEATKARQFTSLSMKKGRSWKSKLSLRCNCLFSCFKESTMPKSSDYASKDLTLVTWSKAASLSSPTSSSSKIRYASCSKDDVDDSSSDFVDDFCMISGSHASTLGRLLAWEKKLCDEVKEIDSLKREYDRKCIQLRHLEAKDESADVVDKTRAVIKDLHSRIKVSIQAVSSISKRIQKLRDDELQPQLIELIEGMLKMWKTMLDCHQSQHQLMISNISSHVFSLASRETHKRLSFELEKELMDWQVSFGDWTRAQKNYIYSLKAWLLKCILQNTETSTRSRSRFSPRRDGAPPVVVICNEWNKALDGLHSDEVVKSIKTLAMKLNSLSVELDEDQKMEKNVEGLRIDNGIKTSRGKTEARLFDSQDFFGIKRDPTTSVAGAQIADKKDLLESFRKRAEEGQERCTQNLQDAYLNSLRTGLLHVFASLESFASDSYKMFHAVKTQGEEALVNFEEGMLGT